MRFRSIQSLSTSQIIRLAATISIVSLTLWIGFTLLVWWGLMLLGTTSDFWVMLESISTAAAVAQFLGGGVVVLWQLRDSADSRNMSIYNDIFEKLMSDRDIEARRWIYTQLPDNPEQGIVSLSPDGQEQLKRVLNTLDHLGFLLEQEWITSDAEGAVIKWVSPFVVKVWMKIEPYIDYEARRRQEPDYYENVRLLASRCLKWRAEKLPNARINWVKDAL